MPWKFQHEGYGADMEAAIKAANADLTGNHLAEWNDAKEILLDILDENYASDTDVESAYHLSASGTGRYNADGQCVARELNVNFHQVYAPTPDPAPEPE